MAISGLNVALEHWCGGRFLPSIHIPCIFTQVGIDEPDGRGTIR